MPFCNIARSERTYRNLPAVDADKGATGLINPFQLS